jgi:hypothetical protein
VRDAIRPRPVVEVVDGPAQQVADDNQRSATHLNASLLRLAGSRLIAVRDRRVVDVEVYAGAVKDAAQTICAIRSRAHRE